MNNREGEQLGNYRKINPWGIGKVQIIALIAGLIIYGLIDYGLGRLANGFSGPSFIYYSFFSLSYFSINLFVILIGLQLVVALFFGITFGPWVGAIIAMVGGYVGDYLVSPNFPLPWNWYLGSAIFGFLAGLAFVMSKGRNRNIGTNINAGLIGAGALAAGIGFFALNDIWVSHINAFSALSEFLINVLPGLILAIVLLPIALTVYGKVISRK